MVIELRRDVDSHSTPGELDPRCWVVLGRCSEQRDLLQIRGRSALVFQRTHPWGVGARHPSLHSELSALGSLWAEQSDHRSLRCTVGQERHVTVCSKKVVFNVDQSGTFNHFFLHLCRCLPAPWLGSRLRVPFRRPGASGAWGGPPPSGSVGAAGGAVTRTLRQLLGSQLDEGKGEALCCQVAPGDVRCWLTDPHAGLPVTWPAH